MANYPTSCVVQAGEAKDEQGAGGCRSKGIGGATTKGEKAQEEESRYC